MSETADFLTLDEHFRFWAKDRPDAIAQEQGERLTTYAELEVISRRVAAFLESKGLKKGDRIAWIGKNDDLYFQLLFGAGRVGVVMAPIGWRLAPAEMAFILNDTGTKLAVAGEEFLDIAQGLKATCPALAHVLGEAQARAEIMATPPAETIEAAGPDDAMLQLYTSGTTGNPKGAVLCHRNMFGLRRPSLDAGLPWAEWDKDEAILVCMPCAHIGGTGLGTMAFGGGVRAIIHAEFTAEGALTAVGQGITRFFIVPAALQMLIQHPLAANTDFSKLKYVMYGAAPIPLELLREAVQTIPNAGFMQCYGMTETTGTVVSLVPDDHDLNGSPKMRSAGRANPGVEVRIVDAQGNEVPRGTVGEIETRSSNNMLGYWNLPEATAKTLSADGWVRTGDAAYMDDEGYIYIQDRIKDMIISGGENVYPAEVESAIYGHPDVLEVAVIGVPDAKWGEAVKAVCVPKEGHVVDPANVIAWARERIAAFKVPKSVDVIDALPRNPTGKVLRRSLRDPYWEGMDRQVN
ncbi:long-chain-fatty-acid--CoA ligase [Novosphingobium sp. KCTC 2891]|uniref:long-chain-fatty-acid--CoA ligase n=1 Tax=Novosphingobium sp. KCTC 2891 TaxID=2989730 RepID=UPI0022236E24|nr:long-chain-fatty-acid--CoA ligase [Novosphingobium sp. KCTC 2891]MCW1383458.1 long-chain-fatty-acid--CoA ligase [Novosphingobium sp. KCTC 2891]